MSNNVINVGQHRPIEVSHETYPWINTPGAEVSAIVVELGETAFLYGSIIGLNKSIRKVADSVPTEDSSSLQTVLFSSLPAILSGNPHQGIGKVENSDFVGSTLFTASRNIVREPSLIFTLADKKSRDELPLVLRAGVSTAKNLPRVLGLMGIKQAGGQRRKN